MKIKTNNQPRDIIFGIELTEKEQKEFDYLEGDDLLFSSFFRYKGQVYDLGEFSWIIPQGSTRCHPTESDNPAFAGWHGYMSDSFFSGVLVEFVEDNERVIVGVYFA